ncbi:hypothetical protein J4421_01225 [Candidatus Woesearchaeota archaeon]|nr:hypothetical protein [Candidatus Woesearchaeota archaeon]
MSLFTVGRMCVKIAGRDAGRKAVVVEEYENGFVLIDGATRRKKVNMKHLEPLDQILEIKTKASHDEVRKVFEKLGLKVWDSKAKKVSLRPKKQKVKKERPAKEEKKKQGKKEEKAEEAQERESVEIVEEKKEN